jgi:hypothetical protein
MINRNMARAATRTQFVRSKATTARDIINKNNQFKVRQMQMIFYDIYVLYFY